MKIRLLSDLHLELDPFTYIPLDEDIVVLAGDIATPSSTPQFEQLIESISNDKQIVMIAGNHEYYQGVFERMNEYLSSLQAEYSNFTFLNNSSTVIDNVPFFGGVQFTDFQLGDSSKRWNAPQNAKRFIRDFDIIYRTDATSGVIRRWNTTDHKEEHDKFCASLKEWMLATEGQKRVVISHFLCAPGSIHPQYATDFNSVNAYFCADMTRFMGWDGIWLHGHTHTSCQYRVGDTRVYCNPKGYRTENSREFDPNLVIEL